MTLSQHPTAFCAPGWVQSILGWYPVFQNNLQANSMNLIKKDAHPDYEGV
jgi:hypothetical protein